jgi:hypothetical protein
MATTTPISFPTWLLTNLLANQGWPRKKGLRRRSVISASILLADLSIVYRVGVALGCASPDLALRLFTHHVQSITKMDIRKFDPTKIIDDFDCHGEITEALPNSPWDTINSRLKSKLVLDHIAGEMWELKLVDNITNTYLDGFYSALFWGLCYPDEAQQELTNSKESEAAIYEELRVRDSSIVFIGEPAPSEFVGEAIKFVEAYDEHILGLPEIDTMLLSESRISARFVNTKAGFSYC